MAYIHGALVFSELLMAVLLGAGLASESFLVSLKLPSALWLPRDISSLPQGLLFSPSLIPAASAFRFCVCAHGSQSVVSFTLCGQHPHCFLRQDLSLDLELVSWARLIGQQGPRIGCLYLPGTGIVSVPPA